MSEAPILCGKPKKDGTPCGQVLGPNRECIWHGAGVTPEDRSAIARRGGLQTIRSLPLTTELPSFDNRENIVAFAEERAHMVETGQLDPRLSAESRGWADLAMKAHELSALDRLAKLERRIVGKRIS